MTFQPSLFDQLESAPESFAGDGPAKGIAWLGRVLEWLTREADCGAKYGVSWENSVPNSFLEKTSLDFCRFVDAASAPRSDLSKICTPTETTETHARALDALTLAELRKLIQGEISSVCWPTWRNSGMGSPIAFSTLNSGEWPKDAAVCSLSLVLETGDVPRKYYLSPTACRGILRRAEKRGKVLPQQLLAALTAVAQTDLAET